MNDAGAVVAPAPDSPMAHTERYIYRISNTSFEGWMLQIAGFGVSE